jgi:hypothetical protein
VGRRWRPFRQTPPPRRDRHDRHRRLPAQHGQRRQQVCRGFQGAFLCGGGCGELLPVLPGGCSCPPCAGETASGGAPPRHPGAATRARTGPRSREARQRPAVRTGKRWKTVLLPPRTRKPRWRRSPAHGTGHHDHRRYGCRGRRTATTERAPALVSVPGSASAREQERRAAASNIPDSVSYFVSPNGPTTGPRRAPAIARHRTISWNGVSQEESGWAAPTFPISGLAGPVSWCTPEARHVL